MGSGNLNIFVAVSAKWLLLALIAAASAPFWTPAQAYGQGYWNLASHSQGNIQLNVNPGGGAIRRGAANKDGCRTWTSLQVIPYTAANIPARVETCTFAGS